MVPVVYLHTCTNACGCFTADILHVCMCYAQLQDLIFIEETIAVLKFLFIPKMWKRDTVKQPSVPKNTTALPSQNEESDTVKQPISPKKYNCSPFSKSRKVTVKQPSVPKNTTALPSQNQEKCTDTPLLKFMYPRCKYLHTYMHTYIHTYAKGGALKTPHSKLLNQEKCMKIPLFKYRCQ